MGDAFFKVFFISCFIILFLAGGIMFYQMQEETVDRRQVERYLSSRGKAPVPKAWRDQIGNGI